MANRVGVWYSRPPIPPIPPSRQSPPTTTTRGPVAYAVRARRIKTLRRKSSITTIASTIPRLRDVVAGMLAAWYAMRLRDGSAAACGGRGGLTCRRHHRLT